MSDDSPPAPSDAISALQVAEDQLQAAEDALSDGLSHSLPGDVTSGYRERKKKLWRYRNYLLDLRVFLEECEEAGVFANESIDEVANDWMHAPDAARRQYLDE